MPFLYTPGFLLAVAFLIYALLSSCRLPFGSVTSAGTIWRKDIEEPDRLMFGGGMRETVLARKEGVYSNVKRIYRNNCLYIEGLEGLMSWYFHIRSMFVSDFFSRQLLIGMMKVLESAIDERINRLDDFVNRLGRSKELILSGNGGKITPVIEEHDVVIQEWPSLRENFEQRRKMSVPVPPEELVIAIEKGLREHGQDYIRVIQSLDASIADTGSKWLESIILSYSSESPML
ncbi:MAG: hypothetical protein HQK67_00200 [Desulfamplus sp.]|nr:hypothetical protein [Desulfamplus sp.]